MKLVWIAQDLHIGGGQRTICRLSAELARRGHEVEIIYPRGRGGLPLPDLVRGTPVGVDIDQPVASLAVNFPALMAAVPECDWVLTSMPVSAFAGFLAGRLRQARVLSYVMNDERALFDDQSLLDSSTFLSLYHRVADWSHRLPVTVVVNSHWTGTRMRRGRGFGYPIVPPGVDLEIFRPEGPSRENEGVFTVVTVGRRHRWKGTADLVKALNQVKRERAAGREFQLWVVTQDDLDLRAAEFPVRIIKPAGDREIAAAYRGADLLIHPSWFEGFGLPPLEAMACGTPTVLTDSGGVREYAVHEGNCLMTPVKDPAALARAVTELWDHPDHRRRLAQAGPPTAARFTWDHAAETLLAVLTQPR
ncbi:MAG: glycosyltransferase family 1 protein [Candidatus Zixiibacteriota bacterium]|nr:MAG: glycosyltransferase family 1 protein [candidate division Zixibacteria bacterium]